MSQPFAQVPHWLLRGEGPALESSELRLVLAIWSHESGRDREPARVSVGTLARELQLSPAQVKRLSAALVDRGLLKRWSEGANRANRYSVAAFIERGPCERTPAPTAAAVGSPMSTPVGSPMRPEVEVS